VAARIDVARLDSIDAVRPVLRGGGGRRGTDPRTATTPGTRPPRATATGVCAFGALRPDREARIENALDTTSLGRRRP